MRHNGVQSLWVLPGLPSRVVLGVDAYPDDTPVPSFGPKMICTRCGMLGADARPNWGERR
jgi:hypothetical protein